MRNNSNRLIKRLMILFVGVIGFFGLASCTKSFTTNQDKANQLYAYYGNIYETSVDLADDENGYDNLTLQNQYRETLYTTINSNGYSAVDTTYLTYMNNKVDAFVTEYYTLWTNDTLAKEDETTAKQIAKHVGIYAGLDKNESGNYYVTDLFTNMTNWWTEALSDSSVGILKTPSQGYLNLLKSTLTTTVSSLRAGFSPESRNFTHGGSTVYIEGKSWGEAFSEYGFLEGLLVYPFAWIIHKIASVDVNNGWMQILAIAVVTIIARLITVISTIIQTRSNAKQQRIQPLLNQIQKKYPEGRTDPEQRRAMALEQSQLMKKYKVHPFLPMLFLIIQFPLFICVWAALQDSAALASSSWLGLSLTTTVNKCFTSYSTTPGALVGIFIFIVMSVANVLSSSTSLFFNTWRTKNFGSTMPQQQGPDGQVMDPNKTMKMMTIIMAIFVLFMGWSLPAGMSIYWILGALISIIQTLIMEIVQTKQRHNFTDNTGDGSTLATVRRSKHHTATVKSENGKKSKSQKPMWR